MAGKTAYVDFTKFDRAMTGLVQLTRKSYREVIRAEAGSILKTCAGRTKVSTPEKADIRARGRVTKSLGYSGYSAKGTRKSDHPITVNSGQRGPAGRVFMLKRDGHGFRRTHEADFIPLHQHYKSKDWRDLWEAVRDVQSGWNRAIPLGRAAIGLARQSWVQIARSIGIDLKRVPGGRISAAGIAKAEKAMGSDGNLYNNGTATEKEGEKSFIIRMVNSLPYCRRAGLDRVLVSAVNGRAAFFQKNLSKGVFDSMTKIARAYPGFKVAA